MDGEFSGKARELESTQRDGLSVQCTMGVIKLCLAKVFFHCFSGNFSSLDSFVLFSFIITCISNNLDVMISFVLYIAYIYSIYSI